MLVDQLKCLRECASLIEQISNLREYSRCRFPSSDQLFKFPSLVTFEPLEGERPQHGRPTTQYIAAERKFVEVVAAPILQVVENLKPNAEVLRESRNGLGILIGWAGESETAVERGFECWGGFECVDF